MNVFVFFKSLPKTKLVYVKNIEKGPGFIKRGFAVLSVPIISVQTFQLQKLCLDWFVYDGLEEVTRDKVCRCAFQKYNILFFLDTNQFNLIKYFNFELNLSKKKFKVK